MITDDELQALNHAIRLRYGIDFTNYEPNSFKRRVVRVLQKYGFESSLALWQAMLKDNQFIFKMIDEITVGLTEMFRNPLLWQTIRDNVLTQLQNQSQIKLWHIGCSTGEEVYTLRIVLQQKNLLAKTLTTATDLNSQAIRTAIEGIYPLETLELYEKNFQLYQQNPERHLHNFYRKIDSQRGQMHEYLRNNILFKVANLTKPEDYETEKYDLVFCRNVMIYFDEILKERVIRQIYDALNPNGFFVLGYYDALSTQQQQLFEVYDASCKIYRKKTNVLHLANQLNTTSNIPKEIFDKV